MNVEVKSGMAIRAFSKFNVNVNLLIYSISFLNSDRYGKCIFSRMVPKWYFINNKSSNFHTKKDKQYLVQVFIFVQI